MMLATIAFQYITFKHASLKAGSRLKQKKLEVSPLSLVIRERLPSVALCDDLPF